MGRGKLVVMRPPGKAAALEQRRRKAVAAEVIDRGRCGGGQGFDQQHEALAGCLSSRGRRGLELDPESWPPCAAERKAKATTDQDPLCGRSW
jgi:hypothetical protein